MVAEQSLFIGNGSFAFQVFGNISASTGAVAPVFFLRNTTWGNGLGYGGSGGGAEINVGPVGKLGYGGSFTYDSNRGLAAEHDQPSRATPPP